MANDHGEGGRAPYRLPLTHAECKTTNAKLMDSKFLSAVFAMSLIILNLQLV